MGSRTSTLRNQFSFPSAISSQPPLLLLLHLLEQTERLRNRIHSICPHNLITARMAILQGCPGIEVTIVSNGIDLEEYPDEEVQFNNRKFFAPLERRSMSYIECTSDAEFGIKWKLTAEYDTYNEHTHLSFWAYVDGQAIGGMTTRADTGRFRSFVHAEAFSRINDAELASRKLKFCSIKKGLLFPISV